MFRFGKSVQRCKCRLRRIKPISIRGSNSHRMYDKRNSLTVPKQNSYMWGELSVNHPVWATDFFSSCASCFERIPPAVACKARRRKRTVMVEVKIWTRWWKPNWSAISWNIAALFNSAFWLMFRRVHAKSMTNSRKDNAVVNCDRHRDCSHNNLLLQRTRWSNWFLRVS